MGNPWLEHIKRFRKKHSGLSFKDVLKGAKSTYKPVGKKSRTACKSKSRKRKSKSRKRKTKSRKRKSKSRKRKSCKRRRRRSGRGGGGGKMFDLAPSKVGSTIEQLSLANNRGVK